MNSKTKALLDNFRTSQYLHTMNDLGNKNALPNDVRHTYMLLYIIKAILSCVFRFYINIRS